MSRACPAEKQNERLRSDTCVCASVGILSTNSWHVLNHEYPAGRASAAVHPKKPWRTLHAPGHKTMDARAEGRGDGLHGDDDSRDGRIGGNDTRRYITEYRPSDILTGKGLGQQLTIQQHPGNVEFKRLISTWAAEYHSSKAKGEIAKSIAKSISDNNGRFLRQIEALEEAKQLGAPESVTAWVQMNDSVVQRKIQKALRTNKKNPNPNVITGFDPSDVLCTGDGSAYHHPGNVFFSKARGVSQGAIPDQYH
jgi:hypothetical protein